MEIDTSNITKMHLEDKGFDEYLELLSKHNNHPKWFMELFQYAETEEQRFKLEEQILKNM